MLGLKPSSGVDDVIKPVCKAGATAGAAAGAGTGAGAGAGASSLRLAGAGAGGTPSDTRLVVSLALPRSPISATDSRVEVRWSCSITLNELVTACGKRTASQSIHLLNECLFCFYCTRVECIVPAPRNISINTGPDSKETFEGIVSQIFSGVGTAEFLESSPVQPRVQCVSRFRRTRQASNSCWDTAVQIQTLTSQPLALNPRS